MSGFVGIVRPDGTPVDCGLLRVLTDFLSFRGPDAQETWCDGPVGLGHALLQIPQGTAREKQPAQLDGRLSIVADARIDARSELVRKLHAEGRSDNAPSLACSDAQLILHAYDAWGEGCVEHLLGDFSFAIWDARQRRLFCARDQLGVKPLYYAEFGSCILFSNTLNCIRSHKGISNRLNDLAIADYLLFDMIYDPSATSFAGIRQLPAAHSLSHQGNSLSVRRYWELPIPGPIQFSREEECLERFRELMDAAVADRIQGSGAGVMMSGGLDSTAVAASARRVLAGTGKATGLRAYTEVFESLLPDKERHFATLAARWMKIPIEYIVSDHRRIFEWAEETAGHLPMPMSLAWPDATSKQLIQMAESSRIALTGLGADLALNARLGAHFRQLLGERRLFRMLADAARYLSRPRRLSRLYLRARWGQLFPPGDSPDLFPKWLNPDLQKTWSLRDRWADVEGEQSRNKSARPEAFDLVANANWACYFEALDTGITQVPVEVRHPFFDLRVLNFLLALPRLPWCCDKELLREATRGTLPDAVRYRRKSPLAADPLNALLSKPESAWVDRFEPVAELDAFVDRRKIPPVFRERNAANAWINLRPLSLNFWLRGRED